MGSSLFFQRFCDSPHAHNAPLHAPPHSHTRTRADSSSWTIHTAIAGRSSSQVLIVYFRKTFLRADRTLPAPTTPHTLLALTFSSASSSAHRLFSAVREFYELSSPRRPQEVDDEEDGGGDQREIKSTHDFLPSTLPCTRRLAVSPLVCVRRCLHLLGDGFFTDLPPNGDSSLPCGLPEFCSAPTHNPAG